MIDRTVVVCVLAGGAGTRLYPASRSFRPKPLLTFDGNKSLLEQTLDRIPCADETVILTREEFSADVKRYTNDEEVLIEPSSKELGTKSPSSRSRSRIEDSRDPENRRFSDDNAGSEATE